ncbi:acyltransferase family protein [Actinoalloteichus fjordicus]|uniref:Acyltransferase family protein n=1 Tax=Actinoalloteichus fjordicus TaxID=1612552 RepID=A0AAC9LCY6_9PSEU|nr:acyltransferase [Actinoalloteichus fjordicus]APU14095.1 acyltransferase family protein [Actinoalloteichus fjordicus]
MPRSDQTAASLRPLRSDRLAYSAAPPIALLHPAARQPSGSHPGRGRPRGPMLCRRAEAIDAATPPERDRVIDALRALAIVGVVLGHWLVSVVVFDENGPHIASPLQHMPALAPLTWVFQLLGLFFFAGGWANARSLHRAAGRSVGTAAGRSVGTAAGRSVATAAGRAAPRHRAARTRGRACLGGWDRVEPGSPLRSAYPGWLLGRLHRMLRPVVLLAVLVAGGLGGLAAAGWSGTDLYTVGLFVVSPLWFLPVYLGLTALTPLAATAVRRWGAWAALGPAVVVLVLDVLRYGPWWEVPASVGTPNLIAAWLVPYLLGIAFAQGRLSTAAGLRMLIAGVLACAVLILLADYPASMTGVTGADRSNMGPPSLLVPAMAVAQLGVALLLYERLARLLRRPMLWASVVLLNLVAMTVYLWHQTALLTTQLGTHALGLRLPALDGVPVDAAWLAGRIAVFPVCAAVLALLILLFRRWEQRSAPRVLHTEQAGASVRPEA